MSPRVTPMMFFTNRQSSAKAHRYHDPSHDDCNHCCCNSGLDHNLADADHCIGLLVLLVRSVPWSVCVPLPIIPVNLHVESCHIALSVVAADEGPVRWVLPEAPDGSLHH